MGTDNRMQNQVEILIAEDSPLQAEQLAHILERHNYVVTIAGDGAEAFFLAKKRAPALLISDIVMPDINGYQLAQLFKDDGELKEIPIILVTVLSDLKDILRGFEWADDFISKPYNEKYLLGRIEFLLANKRDHMESEGWRMNTDIRNNIDNFAGSCDNQVKILIVEDSSTQAEKMALILEQQDYRVFIAQNGAEALGLIKSHKPTLIISDILMPEMNGYQLCQAIKENEDFKEIPVILLTSLTDPKDVVKGLECGADNFIAKPYDERYLLSRIQNLLADTHLRESERTQFGVEITLGSEKYFIKSDRIQILNLLFSSYEAAVQKNNELEQTRMDLAKAKDRLEETVVSLAIVNQELHVLNRELDLRRNKTEEDRIRADENTRAKSGFLAKMNHELRTPLNSIIGFSEILEDELFGNLNLKQKEYVMNILSSGKTLLLLINNFTGETKNAEENSLGRG